MYSFRFSPPFAFGASLLMTLVRFVCSVSVTNTFEPFLLFPLPASDYVCLVIVIRYVRRRKRLATIFLENDSGKKFFFLLFFFRERKRGCR